MAPTFYDAETHEPLPAGAVPQPLRPAAEKSGATVPLHVATLVMPSPAPYRLAVHQPLQPPVPLDRLERLPEWIVGLGREGFRIVGPDLVQHRQMDSPSPKAIDRDRGLILGADVFGSLVARRPHDLSIAFRLNPTMPAGFERRVLYVDRERLLLASTEETKRSSRGIHPGEVTMFEWFKLGDVANVDADFVPAGVAITAVMFSRTRPLVYAVAADGDPLLIAEKGHVVWMDRALKPVADVAIPGERMPLALEVDGEGRALMVLRGETSDRLWIVQRSGEQVCDVTLAERSTAIAPVILLGKGGAFFAITGRTVERFDARGQAQWRARLPEAPIAATLLDSGDLMASSGECLLRIDGIGHSDLLFESNDKLVSRPTIVDGRVLVATATEVLLLEPTSR